MEEKYMRKIRVHNNIFIIAKKSPKCRKLDYYMQMPDKTEYYMFTRNYSTVFYEICKAGTPINKILSERTRNEAVMSLVNYLNLTMPYFAETFNLKQVA